MLGQTISHLAVGKPSTPAKNSVSFLNRKIWLPRLIYSCLPWFYLGSGIVAILGTLYINEWFWVLPHYLIFSAACIHFGIVIAAKRRAARNKSRRPAADRN